MPPTHHVTRPVVLAEAGLTITLLTDPQQARTQQAARALVEHLARAALEYLQRRRTRQGLGRTVTPALAAHLEVWRTAVDWSQARLLSCRGSLTAPHVVDGSFDIHVGGRRDTIVCRLAQVNGRWTCIELVSLGPTLPRPERADMVDDDSDDELDVSDDRG
ncbi:Rv3235 family protein [Propionibacteriaceae bacterium G1746]